MKYEKLISLDLEMNQPSGKIIQIGAAIGDPATKTIIDTFGALVDPGEPLSDFIIELTGITPERITAEGMSLQAAAELLFAFVAKHKPSMNPVVWGIGDADTLREQLDMTGVRWVFGRRSVDIKTIHVGMCLSRGLSPKGGLGKTMKDHYGMTFDGRAHDAQYDAENTMRLFFKMQEAYFSSPAPMNC